MSSQNSKKSKSPKVESTPPVVEVAPTPTQTPVVEASVTNPPKVQRAGGKKAAPKVEPTVEATVSVPEVVTTPAPKAQRGKKAVVEAAVTNPVPEVVTTPAPKAQRGKKAVVEASVTEAPVARKQRGGKKNVEVAPPVVESSVVESAAVEEDDKSRSFKVRLPGETEFCGRFTGLTPYQAANKALSKFFRTNENNNISTEQVVFSIKESTRGSKRHEYTYRGTRLKLDQPITYTIKSADGNDRVITKQYKNQLTKVKKGNAVSESAPLNA